MFCKNCGSKIEGDYNVCPNCGTNLKEGVVNNNQTRNEEDRPNMLLNLVSLLLIPLVGIILYFVWRNKTPKRAKSILNYALIGWGISIILNLFLN